MHVHRCKPVWIRACISLGLQAMAGLQYLYSLSHVYEAPISLYAVLCYARPGRIFLKVLDMAGSNIPICGYV